MILDPTKALVLYETRSHEAIALAKQIAEFLHSGHPLPASDEHHDKLSQTPLPEVLISVGGDGTLLRAARVVANARIPILGVNPGRVGFLTEIEAQDAFDLIPRYLDGSISWVDERSQLLAGAQPAGVRYQATALNDVVVGRGPVPHIARISVRVNSVDVTTYQADAVIVATATGSTAYGLAAGGPILHPASSDMIIVPVAAHGDLAVPLVVPATCRIELTVKSEHPAVMTVDGFPGMPIGYGDTVTVTSSSARARFLRSGGQDQFYETLVYRLRRGADQELTLAKLIAQQEANKRKP